MAGGDPDAFVSDMRVIVERLCDATVAETSVKPRLGGKYVSVTFNIVVRAPEVIMAVHEELGRDKRVKMRF